MAFHFDQFAKKAISEGVYLRMPGIMQNAVALGVTIQTMMALQCGMQVYAFQKYDFHFFMECMRKYSLSACFIVPAIWNRIVQECTREDVSSIRFAMSGASPLPLPLQLRVHDMLPAGVVLRVNWGMTETTTGASQPNANEEDREGSSGRLLPNMQAVILGSNGEKLGYDQPGELCVKGTNSHLSCSRKFGTILLMSLHRCRTEHHQRIFRQPRSNKGRIHERRVVSHRGHRALLSERQTLHRRPLEGTAQVQILPSQPDGTRGRSGPVSGDCRRRGDRRAGRRRQRSSTGVRCSVFHRTWGEGDPRVSEPACE